jgi:hypothetical protein
MHQKAHQGTSKAYLLDRLEREHKETLAKAAKTNKSKRVEHDSVGITMLMTMSLAVRLSREIL